MNSIIFNWNKNIQINLLQQWKFSAKYFNIKMEFCISFKSSIIIKVITYLLKIKLYYKSPDKLFKKLLCGLNFEIL